jgi:hypothetical protein
MGIAFVGGGMGLPITLRNLARRVGNGLLPIALAVGAASTASAADRIYFSATDNVTDVLVSYIRAETVRLDISSWYLSEHSISIAIANRFAAGVPVRLIADRGAAFENDPHTKTELYWLASQGVPIRLRFNPTWFPELDHWKAAIFVGQNTVEFGSGNFAPTELAPYSSTNYCDETELFTSDPAIVKAFKTKFDVKWNDTTREPQSIISDPPYLKDWNDACAKEPTGNCSDYYTLYPTPTPMVINTARLEPDYPTPPDLIWGQGPDFNNRLTQEINADNRRIDMVVYRLEVDNITQALLNKFWAGVPVRLIVDPDQYTNIRWPEYWLTHANIDKLWAAGVPIRQRLHAGVTHMKMLVTSTYATNASSNFGPNWQRDHNYFVSAATKPTIYQAMANRFQTMWNDTSGFGPLQPTPPNAAALASPATGSTGAAPSTSLVWNTAAWAVSYDVYMGTSPSSMTLVGNTPAQMVLSPPGTYSWTPSTPLPSGTTYYWKVVSRTNATPVNPSMIATSATWSFTTGGQASQLPTAPSSPSPSTGSTGISMGSTLTWNAPGATSYAVSFGASNPPPLMASAVTSASYNPGTLATNTTYFWQVTAINSGGSTPGPVWSFTTDAPATSQAVGSDFDGDGRADLTVFRPSTGSWYILRSGTGYTTSMSVSLGLSTDMPVPGDYDGDGKVDPAVYRPSTGRWFILTSSSNYTTSTVVSWGVSTDVPVPGDYDGDFKVDPAVYRPSTGQWFVLNSNTSYTSSIVVPWGVSTDVPVPGDYDGDFKVDPAVYRPSTGQWFVLNSNTSYTSSIVVSWGVSTDVPVPGDYDGDGKTDPAVYRPSTGQWFTLNSSTSYTSSGMAWWGLSTDIPVPRDYDGDRKTDPAVYRPSTGQWWVLKSSTNFTTNVVVSWGGRGDIPINKQP